MSVSTSASISYPVLPILGTMTFADQTDLNDAKQQLELFTSLGYDRVDTARMYSYGHTEEMLGEIFAENQDFRGKLIVDSKVNPFKGYDDNLIPENVKRQIDSILKSLRCESIDALFLHAPGTSISFKVVTYIQRITATRRQINSYRRHTGCSTASLRGKTLQGAWAIQLPIMGSRLYSFLLQRTRMGSANGLSRHV